MAAPFNRRSGQNPDGTLDTPRMPVAEHRRVLANALFQLANGFCQVMRGVADAAGPLASLGPAFDEAVDPRRDTRPDADGIFNPAFVDLPEALKQSARDHRRTVPVNDVRAAWTRCEWGHMAYVPLIGETTTLARKADFTAALPHLGTKLVAYHAEENFVCREYGFLGAVVVAAESEAAAKAKALEVVRTPWDGSTPAVAPGAAHADREGVPPSSGASTSRPAASNASTTRSTASASIPRSARRDRPMSRSSRTIRRRSSPSRHQRTRSATARSVRASAVSRRRPGSRRAPAPVASGWRRRRVSSNDPVAVLAATKAVRRRLAPILREMVAVMIDFLRTGPLRPIACPTRRWPAM